jgi:hypothetical protein
VAFTCSRIVAALNQINANKYAIQEMPFLTSGIPLAGQEVNIWKRSIQSQDKDASENSDRFEA